MAAKAKRLNLANNDAKYRMVVNIYYDEDNADLIEESLDTIEEKNVFLSGFFKFILENPDFVYKLCDKVPKARKYRKGIF